MEKGKEIEAKLSEVKAEVMAWRKGRKTSSRVPDHLWDKAIEFVGQYGLYRTSQELGLYYEGLKRRSEQNPAKSKLSKPMNFLEMKVIDVPAKMHECVVHLKDRGMEIQFKSQEAGSLGVMVREMLRAGV